MKNLIDSGKYLTHSVEAQGVMFPKMVDHAICSIIDRYRSRVLGWKLSGADGGDHLILIHDRRLRIPFASGYDDDI